MKTWKTAALAAALVAAGAAGAALAPAAHGQTARVVTPDGLEIINAARGSRLGVTVKDVDAATVKAGQPAGVAIESVSEDSAAGRAGVRAGDIVVEYDGERVRSVRQFTRLVQESVAGRPVSMSVLRDGQRQSLTVSPEESGGFRVFDDGWSGFMRPAPPRPPAPPAPPSRPRFPEIDSLIWRTGNALGITLGDLSPQLAGYFGVEDGVLVSSVHEGSVAERAGLKAGDVVTSVNGVNVRRPAELRREVQRLDRGAEFTIDVVREKKALTLKGKTEERREQRRTFWTGRTVI